MTKSEEKEEWGKVSRARGSSGLPGRTQTSTWGPRRGQTCSSRHIWSNGPKSDERHGSKCPRHKETPSILNMEILSLIHAHAHAHMCTRTHTCTWLTNEDIWKLETAPLWSECLSDHQHASHQQARRPEEKGMAFFLSSVVKKICQSKILYVAKIFFKNKGEIKNFQKNKKQGSSFPLVNIQETSKKETQDPRNGL